MDISTDIIDTSSNNDIYNIPHIENSISLEDDINSMLLNITNEKRKNKREAYKTADKLLKGKCYKEDFNQINDIMLDINCNACNSKNIVEINGFYVCSDCGLCNDCIIDSGQEWRFYGADENKGSDPSRCDIPTNELLPKTSIGALVGFGSKETKTSKRIRNMNHW